MLEKDVDKIKQQSAPAVTDKAPADSYITKDKALALALEHAKLEAAQVKHSRVELDRDDRIVHYEIDFVAGVYEYEYEINKGAYAYSSLTELNDGSIGLLYEYAGSAIKYVNIPFKAYQQIKRRIKAQLL